MFHLVGELQDLDRKLEGIGGGEIKRMYRRRDGEPHALIGSKLVRSLEEPRVKFPDLEMRVFQPDF